MKLAYITAVVSCFALVQAGIEIPKAPSYILGAYFLQADADFIANYRLIDWNKAVQDRDNVRLHRDHDNRERCPWIRGSCIRCFEGVLNCYGPDRPDDG